MESNTSGPAGPESAGEGVGSSPGDVGNRGIQQDAREDLGHGPNPLKRPFSGLVGAAGKRRKGVKVTRACDTCKRRKARCSGTIPCDSCTKRGRPRDCHYHAEYRRGQLVTPVQSTSHRSLGAQNRESTSTRRQESSPDCNTAIDTIPDTSSNVRVEAAVSPRVMDPPMHVDDAPALSEHNTAAPSRASPELEVAEIQGQLFDTTSGLAFVHRAFRRLSQSNANQVSRPLPDFSGEAENEESPTLTVGDKPIGVISPGDVQLPSMKRALELVYLYFDVCIATYRFLHLPTVERWLQVMLNNRKEGLQLYQGLGRAKAAILLTMLAIATAHEEKATGRFHEDEAASMSRIDSLFSTASFLIQHETARPTLESAQARVVQVIFLLTTSRMNQAWYTFGTAIQLISALGLHRKAGKRRFDASSEDYIVVQCRRRTFWTAYILDKYMGVIFGRPRHYNDDEIDQEMPDSINDEDMTPNGARTGYKRGKKDCATDALIFHSKIASILSDAARTVYSIKQIPRQDRIAAANRLSQELRQWKASLPPHLGSISPSSLIPRFRRQATTLKIAYSHATMHVNRLFLLGRMSAGSETQIREAIIAANTVLETVDDMVSEGGTIFHAFWWTHYVTFCALAIVYAWEIQSRKGRTDLFPDHSIDRNDLMELAGRCQRHLAQATASNSPSRRYALILDKLRKEVTRSGLSEDHAGSANTPQQGAAGVTTSNNDLAASSHMTASHDQDRHYGLALDLSSPQTNFGQPLDGVNWSIQDWQSEDWLNLDSMVRTEKALSDQTAQLTNRDRLLERFLTIRMRRSYGSPVQSFTICPLIHNDSREHSQTGRLNSISIRVCRAD